MLRLKVQISCQCETRFSECQVNLTKNNVGTKVESSRTSRARPLIRTSERAVSDYICKNGFSPRVIFQAKQHYCCKIRKGGAKARKTYATRKEVSRRLDGKKIPGRCCW